LLFEPVGRPVLAGAVLIGSNRALWRGALGQAILPPIALLGVAFQRRSAGSPRAEGEAITSKASPIGRYQAAGGAKNSSATLSGSLKDSPDP
jgi:hypothetical protein